MELDPSNSGKKGGACIKSDTVVEKDVCSVDIIISQIVDVFDLLDKFLGSLFGSEVWVSFGRKKDSVSIYLNNILIAFLTLPDNQLVYLIESTFFFNYD